MKFSANQNWNRIFLLLAHLFLIHYLQAQRVRVLPQIDLPHNYYYRELYLPQLTSGPSSVAWLPDGKSLIFSMGGSLWKQEIGTETAEQLTDGNGYDYQPDCSPDGKRIIFVRYDGLSMELMLFDLLSRETIALTENKAVNLEPRWSPDGRNIVFVSTIGTGHFLLYKAAIEDNEMMEVICLTPDRKSLVKRYYYSEYDHAINPVWSRDGKEIYFISNHEIIHGTGDIVKMNIDSPNAIKAIYHEETNWKTRPDISPDNSRMVYASYLGGNWHQLWLSPTEGGSPLPLTYGEFDNSSPRWSPDGKKIAFISNRTGNTSLWIVSAFDGGQQQVIASDFHFVQAHGSLTIKVLDENGAVIPARISVTDSREKFYAPADAWIQADDASYPKYKQYEQHYFHCNGVCLLMVPKDLLNISISHGPEYEMRNVMVDNRNKAFDSVVVILKKLELPTDFGNWRSADLHVHMNYGGYYHNTPEKLKEQAKAEDVNFAYNLIVNKEQRIPDVKYFSSAPDQFSTDTTMIFHCQEFHTSYWGHLGLLHLNNHLILPDYVAYPKTAVASLFPDNKFIADRAHDQNGLVGYVHPFEQSEIFPTLSPTLTNELPIDAALGVVDYYELLGFSDHKASEAVWYKLLNCGLHIPAGAGTDYMANYASLRGPIGLNRVYVKQEGKLNPDLFLKGFKKGGSFVTNGPIIGFTVENAVAGDTIFIHSKSKTFPYTAFLRSNFPVNHFEIVWNGEVIKSYLSKTSIVKLDVNGRITVRGSGWLLLHTWNDSADVNLTDIYPYASTNPVYIISDSIQVKSKSAGEYFEKWIDQIEAAVLSFNSYRNTDEKAAILSDIKKARNFYEDCVVHPTIK